MVFSSIVFVFFFLPCCILGYYGLAKTRTQKNNWLLACSLLFYAWGGIAYLPLMILSIVVNWLIAKKVDHAPGASRRVFLIAGLCFNIGLLFVFKYLQFTINNLNFLFYTDLPVPDIALPLGISFFTFQSMSYLIDVFRGEKALTAVNEVGLYISLFPQLVAGPIVRYSDIKLEIRERKECYDAFFDGIVRFVQGLGKKAIIANTVALTAKDAFDGGFSNSLLYAWLGAIAYTLQIYFDFSGYSDMAIGLGKMFGFHFKENFNEPYLSKSVSEFWRRWHISMGSWFRDYVYFPLGGSRRSMGRTYLNLFIVWLLTGLWHGANWTFVLWGLLHFSAIAIEKTFSKRKSSPEFHGVLRGVFGHAYTMLIVCFGWVFFNSDSVLGGFRYLSHMFVGPLVDSGAICVLRENAAVFSIAILLCAPTSGFRNRIKPGIQAISTAVIFTLSVCYILKNAYNPFIYFNF